MNVASLQRAVAPMGGATATLILRAAGCCEAAAVAAGVAGSVRRCGVNATRNPPRLAQSADVPGLFTKVPFMQSATALSEGGSADAGVTTFCGAGGIGAVAGTRIGAGAAAAGATVVAGVLRGGGGGAPCADAREGISAVSTATAAALMKRALVVMGSP